MIKLAEGIDYSPYLELHDQSNRVQGYIAGLMDKAPDSVENEPCLMDCQRPLKRVWQTESGALVIETITYNSPADSKEFGGISHTKISVENGA